MMLQLSPRIECLTPKGWGDCLGWIDYGPEINTIWIVHLFDSGEVLHFDSSDIKIRGNKMWGIEDPESKVFGEKEHHEWANAVRREWGLPERDYFSEGVTNATRGKE